MMMKLKIAVFLVSSQLYRYHKCNIYYYFRAQNQFGISDWSQSDHIDLENVFKNQPVSLSQFGPIIGGTLAGLLLICVLMFLFALNIIKTSQEKKPILLGTTTGKQSVQKNPKNPRNPTELFEGFQILDNPKPLRLSSKNEFINTLTPKSAF